MRFEYDRYGNIDVPHYVLCKGNGDRIGIINCVEKKTSLKFNAYNEISFTSHMSIDNEKNEYYDLIKEGKFIELPLIGRYVISNVSVQSESSKDEYKECTALSSEVLMAQKYLENFIINAGVAGSIDGVKFYNLADPDKSLLHLVLKKCPDWTIGHVDTSLMDLERYFEIDRNDVYSTLVNDISGAFQCIFLFDTLHQRVNVYAEDNIGNDTNIVVSYDNLLKKTNITSSIDDIKTCLTVTGADDLSLREANMGYDRIYNFDYFNSLEYMSNSLYREYNTWKNLWAEYSERYTKLTFELRNTYAEIEEIRSHRMPSDPESTTWSEYGLNPLKEKLAEHEGVQAVMIKEGQADPGHVDYNDMYLPCYNAIQDIKAQIEIVEKEIKSIEDRQVEISDQMTEISSLTSIENNFSEASQKELSKYIREDELSSDNYVVTDTMTDSERLDMLNDMLEYGKKELAKVSQPVLEFDSDMLSLHKIPEFLEYVKNEDFEVGNYIHIIIRDNYIVKARILTMDIDWMNPENFKVAFSNVMRTKGSRLLSSINEAIDLAQSAATSVSMNSSYWNQANKDSSEIMQMLADGLAAAGQAITTSSADVVIDDRGIVVSNVPESTYPKDRIFIGGSQILFSDDDFKTVSTALGRINYKRKGEDINTFGLLANVVLSGYVGAGVIEGNEIIGGTITGTEFNNGNGTFKVDADGALTASNVNISGGTLNINDKFIVGSDGTLTATAGTFSGAINGGSININNNFIVDSSGVMTAKSGTFSGNIIGSDLIIGGSGMAGSIIVYDKNDKKIVDISKNGLKAGKTYMLDSGEKYMLSVDYEYMTLGDFMIANYNGRYILESYEEFTGMSTKLYNNPKKLAFWAAWNSDNDYGFIVRQEGTCVAKSLEVKGDLVVGGNISGDMELQDIKLGALEDEWDSSWASVSRNIIELWEEVDALWGSI